MAKVVGADEVFVMCQQQSLLAGFWLLVSKRWVKGERGVSKTRRDDLFALAYGSVRRHANSSTDINDENSTKITRSMALSSSHITT